MHFAVMNTTIPSPGQWILPSKIRSPNKSFFPSVVSVRCSVSVTNEESNQHKYPLHMVVATPRNKAPWQDVVQALAISNE